MDLLKYREVLTELLMPQKPTYVGLLIRSVVVLIIQYFFNISPFNIARGDIFKATFLFFTGPLLIGTYCLLMCYSFQAIIRIGTIADDNAPFHEKIIASIVLIIVVLGYIYIQFTTPGTIPWYLE